MPLLCRPVVRVAIAQNILVSQKGECLITDFGLARPYEDRKKPEAYVCTAKPYARRLA